MKEIFKDVRGYEGYYKISNWGRVKSIPRRVRNKQATYLTKEIIMTPAQHPKGYYRIRIHKNNIGETLSIARLVAQAFIPNPQNKPQVNHRDGNKRNNHVENLEWVTNKENAHHALKNGLMKILKGEENGISKLTEKQVLEIRKLYGLLSCYQLAPQYNVCPQTIHKVVKYKTWKHL